MALGNSETTSNSVTVSGWWQQLAYHHKWAEFFMYFMFISGLLLWNIISVSWQLERLMLLSHMLVGATLFTLIVGLFWSSHRRLLQTSQKNFLRKTGWVIEWLLIICTLSGFYIFLWGNTGNNVSQTIQNIHFYSSWILAPLVFRHAFRFSILKLKQFILINK